MQIVARILFLLLFYLHSGDPAVARDEAFARGSALVQENASAAAGAIAGGSSSDHDEGRCGAGAFGNGRALAQGEPFTKSGARATGEPACRADAFCQKVVRIGRPDLANQYDYPILSSFLAWRFRYVRPVYCKMVICNSSCARYSDGCDASALDPVLTALTGNGCSASGCQSGGCASGDSP